MSVVIKSTEDARVFFSRLCEAEGHSGYSIEQGINSRGKSNASGARHFVRGRQSTISVDTLITLCDHFGVSLSLEVPKKKKPKKEEQKSSWDISSHTPSWQRLANSKQAR